MLSYPEIDPVAFSIGPLSIRWYGIAYVSGILGAWFLLAQLANRGYGKISSKNIADFVPWATVGIIAGGRLGHVLFYGGSYYLENPAEIFMIWKPGMAFHGGLVGVTLASLWYCNDRKIAVLDLTDMLSVGAPIGLFFGRIANFINSELWGRVTDVPWAMVFPNGGPYPRHPSQLYEALLEGAILFAIQLFMLRFQTNKKLMPGLTTGTFLIFYGLFRIFSEFFREPGDGYIGPFTAGQFLTLPLVVLGVALVMRAQKKTC